MQISPHPFTAIRIRRICKEKIEVSKNNSRPRVLHRIVLARPHVSEWIRIFRYLRQQSMPFSNRRDNATQFGVVFHSAKTGSRYVSVFENIRIRPSTRSRIRSVFKKIYSWERVRKVVGFITAFVANWYAMTEAVSATKKLRIQKYPGTSALGPICLN